MTNGEIIIVQSTISIQNMLMLGGLGHAPREILKNRCSEIEFGDISESMINCHNLNDKECILSSGVGTFLKLGTIFTDLHVAISSGMQSRKLEISPSPCM